VKLTPISPVHVQDALRNNWREPDLAWIADPAIRWYMVDLPLDAVDTRDRAEWASTHEKAKVREFAAEMQAGERHQHPLLAVTTPHRQNAVLLDGHHRFDAASLILHRRTARAHLGVAPRITEEMLSFHDRQQHSGSSPQNKVAVTSARKWWLAYEPISAWSPHGT
jgi:hypothetical protein